MKKRNLLFVALGATLLSSCLRDKYDLETLEVDVSPTFALPLIDADVVTEDLLGEIDTTLISTGSDSVLRVLFNDTVKTIRLDEFLEMEDQVISDNITLPPVGIDDMTNTSTITVAQMKPTMSPGTQAALTLASLSPQVIPAFGPEDGGVQSGTPLTEFTTLTFSQGKLKMTMTNNWAIPLTMSLELKSVTNNNIIDTLHFVNVPANGGAAADSSDLMGEEFSNSIQFDVYEISSTGSGGAAVLINDADELTIDVNFTGAEIVAGSAPIPNQSLTTETVSMSLDSSFKNGEQIETLVFDQASMDYSINYGVNKDSKIYIRMPYATKNGMTFSDSITIDSDNSTPTVVTGTMDLAGYSMDLTAGGTGFNMIEVEVEAVVAAGSQVDQDRHVVFDTSQVVSYDFTMANMTIASVDGYFGTQNVNFADESVETGIANDPLLDKITLVDPKITLYVDNGFGIPMQFDALNMVSTGGTSGSINVTGIQLPAAIAAPTTNNGSVVTTPLEINATNTNIADVVNDQATSITVGGDASINPGGVTSNFATSSSELTVRMNVEIPMYGSFDDIVVNDTIEDLDLSTLFEAAKAITLRSTITNEFPLDGNIQITFVDASYNELGTLVKTASDGDFMKAATTNSGGVVTAPSVQTTDFVLDEATISQITDTKHAILTMTVGSEKVNGSNKAIKILSSSKMNVKLGVIAKVSASGLGSSDEE